MLCLDPFALQNSLPGDPLNQCPEQGKVCSPNVNAGGFAGPPLYFTANWELCHFMVTKPKMASNRHISLQSFSVSKQQI